MTLVKDTLKKADVPFNVRVHSKSSGSVAHVGADDVRFYFNTSLHEAFNGKIFLYKEEVDLQLYLSEDLLSSARPFESQKATMAHEVTHIINLHTVSHMLVHMYLGKNKNIDENSYKKINKLLSSIFEYQADVLPLADHEWAKAQLYEFTAYINNNITQPDIYIGPEKGYVLSSRAVSLHDEEKKLAMGFYDINSPNFMSEALKNTYEEPPLK